MTDVRQAWHDYTKGDEESDQLVLQYASETVPIEEKYRDKLQRDFASRWLMANNETDYMKALRFTREEADKAISVHERAVAKLSLLPKLSTDQYKREVSNAVVALEGDARDLGYTQEEVDQIMLQAKAQAGGGDPNFIEQHLLVGYGHEPSSNKETEIYDKAVELFSQLVRVTTDEERGDIAAAVSVLEREAFGSGFTSDDIDMIMYRAKKEVAGGDESAIIGIERILLEQGPVIAESAIGAVERSAPRMTVQQLPRQRRGPRRHQAEARRLPRA